MSSSEEERSESEESFDEMEQPADSTKNANCEGRNMGSKSDDSDKSKTPSGKANEKRKASKSCDESEHSSSESDSSAVSKQVGKTQGSSQSSHSGSKSTSNVNKTKRVPVAHEVSSSDESQDSDSSSSSSSSEQKPANDRKQSKSFTGSLPIRNIKVEKKSSDEESQESNSGPEASPKNVIKANNINRQSDSSDAEPDFPSKCIKEESLSESSAENEDFPKQTSSSKGSVRKSKLFAQTESAEKSSSETSDSSDSDKQESPRSSGLEEEDDLETSTTQPPNAGKLYSFFEENPIEHSSGVLDVEMLSNHDVWLVHCPKTISDKDLHGASINFSSGSNHKIGNQEFHTTPFREKSPIACVLPSKEMKEYLIVNLPVKGSVLFEGSIKLPKPGKPHLTSRGKVKFPDNLKVRHPLLGLDFKESSSKSSELRRRMKSSKKRKSKEKKRMSNGIESIPPPAELSQTKLKKSSKKRKSRDSISESDFVKEKSLSEKDSVFNEELSTKTPKKAKSLRERKESLSEKGSVFNEETSTKKPKKRKRDKLEDDFELNKSAESPKTKRAKVIKTEDDSGPMTSVESPERKKKKKVEKSEEQMFLTPPVKKSSKRGKSDLDDSIMETLANIKHEVLSSSETTFEGETPKKKKKRKSKCDS